MLSQAASETNWIVAGGATSVLLWVVLGFIKGWIHTDKEFKRETEDKLFYREMALRGTTAAEEVAKVTRDITTVDIDRAVRNALRDQIEGRDA